MVDKALFSSDSDEWATPQDLYDKLNAEFEFTLDPCATPENAKCKRFFTKEDDGLKQTWKDETVFVNPPYSNISEWVRKCRDESVVSVPPVVLLIPSRTDTKYFHGYIWDLERNQPRDGVETRFLKGRLKFGNSKNSAPFPSVVVVFRIPRIIKG